MPQMRNSSVNVPSNKKKRRYITIKTLGRGAFGTVYLAKEEGTDDIYAVKETFLDARYKNREAGILKLVSEHPSIISVHQMFYTQKKAGKYLNIVMEAFPCSLHDVIQKHSLQNKFMDELDIAYYSFELIRACSFLWRLNICHRDIKPQNIVCDPIKRKIRLCDFGSAKQLNDGEWNKHYICSRFYRAPELLCQLNYYSCAVDCWSLGCVIAEMYLNKAIFNGNNTKDQLKLISNILGPIPGKNGKNSYPKVDANYPKEYKLPSEMWKRVLSKNKENKNVSIEGADFIRNLLCYVPDQRFNLKTLKCLNHPFVSKFLPNNTVANNTDDNKDNNNDAKYQDIKFIDNELELI